MSINTSNGVSFDAASIDAFCDGIFGQNRRNNQKAYRTGASVLALAIAYDMYRKNKPAKKTRKKK